MKILFQIDPIDKLDLNTDSSMAIAKEALDRNLQVFFITPNDIVQKGSKVTANIREFNLQNNKINILSYKETDLDDFDLLFIRQDPPFDINYVTNCQILTNLTKVKIINDPNSILTHSEKIYTHKFAEFMPETLISSDNEILLDFLSEHQQVVIKPINLCGGKGISLINKNDKEANIKITQLLKQSQTPIIIQKFCPEVSKGDTRVLLCCGKIMGQVLRIPPAGQIQANFCAGGIADKVILSKKQIKIAQLIAEDCYKNNLYFVGVDFIGEYLTEINVTSPTGIIQASSQMQVNLAYKIMNELIKLI